MLIQPITNHNYGNYQIQNRNNYVSFKGKFGAKVLQELVTSGAKDKEGIAQALKKLGFGALGMFSMSKLADVLESVVAQNDELEREYQTKSIELERKFQKKEEKLNTQISQKQVELDSQEGELATRKMLLDDREEKLAKQSAAAQKELDTKEQKLAERESQLDNREQESDKQTAAKQAQLNTKEQELNKQVAKRQAELDARENEIAAREGQLDLRAKELDELKEKTIKETRFETIDAIRQEEKDAAYNEVADKLLELTKRESDLDEREQALINTENLLKDAEIERLKSEFRTLYGVKDPDLESYNSFGEQITTITSLLNKNRNAMDISATTPTNIAKLMQDKDGIITRDKMQFLEQILAMSRPCDAQDLILALTLVMDKSKKLDSDKAAHFISLLALRNSSFASVIDAFAIHHNARLECIENGSLLNLVNELVNLDYVERGSKMFWHSKVAMARAQGLKERFDNIKYPMQYSMDELKKAANILTEASKALIKEWEGTSVLEAVLPRYTDMLNRLHIIIASKEQTETCGKGNYNG